MFMRVLSRCYLALLVNSASINTLLYCSNRRPIHYMVQALFDRHVKLTSNTHCKERGRRMSTAEAYLRPAARQRPDQLHVLTHAHVTRILFDESSGTPKAIGVEFVHEKETIIVHANQEVIISGGAINSPQILMLSGIGPKEHLKEHKIRVLVDNPALGLAKSLWSRFRETSIFTVNQSVGIEIVSPDDPVNLPLAKLRYHLFGDGEFWPKTVTPLNSVHEIYIAGM